MPSESVVSPFAGTHPDGRLDGDGPDLSVADAAGAGCLDDDVDDVGGVRVADQDLEPDLRYEVHLVLRAAVHLDVATLASVALDLGEGQTGDPEGLERRLHLVELEGLDDCGDQPHAFTSWREPVGVVRGGGGGPRGRDGQA